MPQRKSNLADMFQSLDITTVNEVCTLDDLSAAFDATGLTEPPSPTDASGTSKSTPKSHHANRHIGSNAQHHELHMEYPAFDLLPPGGILHFVRPRDIANRERPHLAFYHIHDTHLGCVVRLETPLQRKFYSRAPSFKKQDNFVAMINRLSDAPGVSTLELLCYENFGMPVCSMRLSTTWMTAVGKTTEMQWYDCYVDELSGCIAALSGVPWADVLDDLVNRASDLSYLLVRDRMMKHSRADAQEEWDTFKWKTETANNVLADCFVLHTREEGDNKSFIDVVTFKRCGHAFRICREYLLYRMTHDECVSFCCSQCGRKAMGKAALRKIAILDDSKTRREYLAKDEMWTKMYSSLNPYAVFQVRNVELREALVDALALLRPPDSIMHPTQSQHNAAETQVLLKAFMARLAKDDDAIIVAPGKTALLLAKIATAALRNYAGVNESVKGVRYVPLGYGRFMHRWLKGTVVLLAARVEAKTSLVVDELSSLLVNDDKGGDVEMTF